MCFSLTPKTATTTPQKPRLIAAGADLNRVHFVNSVRVGGKEKTFSLLTDLQLLRRAIEEIGDIAAVIIDPVGA
jgi:putative DNA primase/helicase